MCEGRTAGCRPQNADTGEAGCVTQPRGQREKKRQELEVDGQEARRQRAEAVGQATGAGEGRGGWQQA